MKLSQLNDYIQTLATIGAIAGLVLVAYEIRQSSRIALAEAYRDGYQMTQADIAAGLETGISRVLVKANRQPEDLSPEEKTELSLWLNLQMNTISSAYFQIAQVSTDVDEQMRIYQKFLESSARFMFGDAWSRAWFYEYGQNILTPAQAEPLRRGLENAPIGLWDAIHERIDKRAAEMM